MERKFIALHDVDIKFIGANAGTFQGYASVFNGKDSYGDTIAPGAFKNTLAKKSEAGILPKMFFDHKSWEMPVGKWCSMSEDSKGLMVEGELTPGHSKAADVLAAMKHGTLDGLSIGFRMSKDDFDVIDNGRGRLIRNISDLVEVSVVTFPADDNAKIDLSSVKSAMDDLETIKDFERFLRDAGGFSKGAATALVARAKEIFRSDSGEVIDAKAMQELGTVLERFKLPGSLIG